MNAIEIRDLSKSFRGMYALDGLNMTVPVGAIYGFIGENGSGTNIFILFNFTHKQYFFRTGTFEALYYSTGIIIIHVFNPKVIYTIRNNICLLK